MDFSEHLKKIEKSHKTRHIPENKDFEGKDDGAEA